MNMKTKMAGNFENLQNILETLRSTGKIPDSFMTVIIKYSFEIIITDLV